MYGDGEKRHNELAKLRFFADNGEENRRYFCQYENLSLLLHYTKRIL